MVDQSLITAEQKFQDCKYSKNFVCLCQWSHLDGVLMQWFVGRRLGCSVRVLRHEQFIACHSSNPGEVLMKLFTAHVAEKFFWVKFNARKDSQKNEEQLCCSGNDKFGLKLNNY